MSNIEKYCNNSCNIPNNTNTNTSTNIIQNNTRNKYAEYIRNHMKSNVNNSVSGSSTSSIKITNFKPCDAGIIGKPVIFIYGDPVIDIEVGSEFIDPGAFTKSSSVIGDIQIHSTLDVNTIGEYLITYYIYNTYGFTNYVTRTVRVITTIPVVITLNGESEMTIERYEPYIELGVSVSHVYDISYTLTITGEVDTSNVNIYELTYTAKTIYNITSSVSRSVEIIDTTPPGIELIGPSLIYVLRFSNFVDPGVKISQGTLFNTDYGGLDMNELGLYTLTYTAIDDYNNSSYITRNVSVEINTPPIIQIAAIYENNTILYNSTFEIPPVNVIYGFIENTVSTVDVLNVGSYNVTYYASSLSGLSSTKVINVEVIDPTTIEISGNNPFTLERYTDYIEPGVSASNRGSVFVNTIIPSSNLNKNSIGNYFINYIAYDFNFNTLATATRQITVVDSYAPVITLNGANPYIHEKGIVFVDPGATAVDFGNIDYTNQINVVSDVCGNLVGEYTITYNVTDDIGNVAQTVIRNVIVQDTTIPEITLLGFNPYVHEKNTSFEEPGFIATDLSNIDLTDNVVIDVDINTSIPKKTFVLKA